MPTLDANGLKQYPGSPLYYRRKMDVLERRAKHKEKLKERIQEYLDTTVLELKTRRRRPEGKLTRDEYFSSIGYNGQPVEKTQFTQISERSMFGGYCRDIPSGATEESWQDEQESQLKATSWKERLCEQQLMAIGYYATIKEDKAGKVWITDLWWAPEELKEEGMLIKAEPLEHTDEGCASLFRRLGFKCEYESMLDAYIVTI
jgi:hypothetical protein